LDAFDEGFIKKREAFKKMLYPTWIKKDPKGTAATDLIMYTIWNELLIS